MSDSLHRYDDVERRFCDADRDLRQRERGLALVARLLGLPALETTDGLRYDLRYFSGGIGVIDRLHVALPCGAAEVDAIVARLGLVTPEDAVADAAWREDFEWFVSDEDGEGLLPLRARVVAFLAEKRADFQPRPDERARVWFARSSNVNTWSVVYEQDGTLCLAAYDQG
ncbi:hypothetical protein [Nannocystis exedens]|uniref:hypothetical protein n=1 Tax=Nannocystis exedens TaxID=54 RepID=UPI0011601827|nr:hypothetical protein [Nannocystis exedens]